MKLIAVGRPKSGMSLRQICQKGQENYDEHQHQ
jgi:hypothetical protein